MLLAPTRILAVQHTRVLRERMPDVEILLLKGGGKDDAQGVKDQLAKGSFQVRDVGYCIPKNSC